MWSPLSQPDCKEGREAGNDHRGGKEEDSHRFHGSVCDVTDRIRENRNEIGRGYCDLRKKDSVSREYI